MKDRPNILLLFTDQQRFDTLAALGNPVIKTPNFDRLVREGTAFTSAYTPSPVCVPARGCMHYGQYTSTLGCYENGDPMPEDRPSFVESLTEAGYRTHGIGKCHFTPESHALRGFETREEQEEMVDDPAKDDYQAWLFEQSETLLTDPHGVRGEMYYIPQPAQMAAKKHPTNWIGERSVKFINDRTELNQPWMLFSSFVHPHPPFAPPVPWHKLYRAFDMPLPHVPQDWETLLLYINHHQNRYKYRDRGIDQNLLRCMKAYYYACISFVDFQIGKILQSLEKTGQLDRTLILMSSDHGELLGDYNSFGKRSMHDSAARIPMLARWPERFAAGTRCEEPVSLVDVAPTALAAAGLSAQDTAFEGVDLAQVASGQSDRSMVFSQLNRAGDAIYMAVSKEWKYVYSAPDNRAFLFDRQNDPAETSNRIGILNDRHKNAEEEMKTALITFLKEHGETEALDGDDFKVYPRQTVSKNPNDGLLIQDHPWADQTIPGYTE